MQLSTTIPGFTVRFASPGDTAAILGYIKALARFEKLEHQVTATEAVLHDSLFVKQQAEVLIGEQDGRAVAFALFFPNFSTFLGKAGLYLEDLFVLEEHRGRGYGKAMLRCLAQVAVQRGCERLDWWCLDWNENAVRFYKSLGAEPMSEWTVFRLEGDALRALGGC